jgi:hypothetical protein
MARDQNLILNPAKLSGPCGRLKCCLAYESPPGVPGPEPECRAADGEITDESAEILDHISD